MGLRKNVSINQDGGTPQTASTAIQKHFDLPDCLDYTTLHTALCKKKNEINKTSSNALPGRWGQTEVCNYDLKKMKILKKIMSNLQRRFAG